MFRPRAPVDKNAYDPSEVRSPFATIENPPADLTLLPDRIWPFAWFFLRQIKWPLFAMIGLYSLGYILAAMIPLFARDAVRVLEMASDQNEAWRQLEPIIWSFVFWVIFLQTACYNAGRFIWSHTSWPLRSLILRQLNIYIHDHALPFFQNDFAGRLSNKVNDVAEGIRVLMRDSLFGLLYAVIQFGMALFLSLQAGPMFMAIFAAFLLSYTFILMYFLPRIIVSSMRVQDSKTRTTGQMVDVITNIYSAKIFSRARFEDSRLLGQVNDLARKGRRMSFSFSKMYMWLEGTNIMLWISGFGLLIWQIQNGQATFAEAALLVPLILSTGQITWFMADTMVALMETSGTVKDGIRTIVKPFTLTDRSGAPDLHITRADIDLDNVTFHYPGRAVFENLNLHIPAGQKVGLVGPSGAGKSTLVQLLLRLHDIQGGTIKIDGQSIADVTQDSLRSSIAVIPQTSDLMHRSIRDNIRYGRLEAADDDIIAAARKAHADDFIHSLQDHEGRTGYDAMVGERGVKLSGGQRQRIAIARAVLKSSPILLLDEATSALDSESERLIQESLQDLMSGRTVIAIAHRLSTIAKLDRLIVMDEGRIIEDGTHHELLRAGGLYARLWGLQSGGFLGDGH